MTVSLYCFLQFFHVGITAAILLNELKNGNPVNGSHKCGRLYSEEIKRFALTLYYNSQNASKFCRYKEMLILCSGNLNFTCAHFNYFFLSNYVPEPI